MIGATLPQILTSTVLRSAQGERKMFPTWLAEGGREYWCLLSYRRIYAQYRENPGEDARSIFSAGGSKMHVALSEGESVSQITDHNGCYIAHTLKLRTEGLTCGLCSRKLTRYADNLGSHAGLVLMW